MQSNLHHLRVLLVEDCVRDVINLDLPTVSLLVIRVTLQESTCQVT